MNDHYYTEVSKSKSEPKEFKLSILDEQFVFKTDNSVFSKSYLDFGSKVLIEAFNSSKKRLLDLGCGYGPIGIILGKVYKLDVTMADINERALDLARQNALQNGIDAKILKSNSASDIEDAFDIIVTNPPIRAGKDIVFSFYENAYRLLNLFGELWVVIQKKQGAESSKKKIESLFGNVQVVDVKKGYVILQAFKNC